MNNRRKFRQLFCATHERLIQERWERLSGPDHAPACVALFGAGAHTRWLLKLVRHTKGPRITVILDDQATPKQRLMGVPVRRPDAFDAATVKAIILSSDALIRKFTARCRALYGKKVPLINLHKDLPPGPYPKET